MQGGDITMESYPHEVPNDHKALLARADLFFVLDNRLFVHGGFFPEKNIDIQERDVLLWDRTLIRSALLCKNNKAEKQLTSYHEVYVGHTPTINFGEKLPIKACEVFLMDTGAGWPGGVLTMMDIDSKEVFQSDPVDQLYAK
jgi:serine/threonine protein phosphatase 1